MKRFGSARLEGRDWLRRHSPSREVCAEGGAQGGSPHCALLSASTQLVHPKPHGDWRCRL